MANAKSNTKVNTVAVETTTPKFDVQAYLASNSATPSGGGFIQNLSYRAGRLTDAVTGSADVFELGRKVGAIAAAKRTEQFRQRAASEIERLLAQ